MGQIVIYKAFCSDVVQGHMNEAPNEIRTHSLRFASASLLTITPPRCSSMGQIDLFDI